VTSISPGALSRRTSGPGPGGERGCHTQRRRMEFASPAGLSHRTIRFIPSSWLWLGLAGLVALSSAAQQTLPPPPQQYVEDATGVLSPATRAALNSRLEAFEREKSSQVVVAIYRRIPEREVLEDYANRLFQAWKIGQRGKDNGALLLVFIDDRRLRIETGYGLEGALPDALCKRIIEEQITPRFRAGDFDGGITAGVEAILAAARAEYQGTGRTMADRGRGAGRVRLNGRLLLAVALGGAVLGALISFSAARKLSATARIPSSLRGFVVGGIGFPLSYVAFLAGGFAVGLAALFFTLMMLGVFRRRGVSYDRRGRRPYYDPGRGVWPMGGGWGGGGGGGGFGGGGLGGGGFGGGGFSGGGGRSGGGGASGSW
jgi:uncharacterized protein